MNIPVPSAHTRHLLTSGWVTFIIALALASPLILWSAERTPPVDVKELALFPAEVRAGETLYRVISVVRRKSCETDVDVIIIDNARVRWFLDEEPIASPGPVGVQDTYKIPLVIPPGAATGEAELRLITKRQCNPMHRLWPIVTSYGPLKFKILPRGS